MSGDSRAWNDGYEQGQKAAAIEIERLRAALQRYGLHTWDCAWNDSRGEQPCNCGWSAMAAKLRGAPQGECPDCGEPYATGVHKDSCGQAG